AKIPEGNSHTKNIIKTAINILVVRSELPDDDDDDDVCNVGGFDDFDATGKFPFNKRSLRFLASINILINANVIHVNKPHDLEAILSIPKFNFFLFRNGRNISIKNTDENLYFSFIIGKNKAKY
ncbi:hypothetical protein DERP_014074, partial [Dermatophagoides pteronyssinus]